MLSSLDPTAPAPSQNARRAPHRRLVHLLAPVALAAVCAISARTLRGDEPRTTRDERSREAVERLIEDLGDEEFDVRERASEALVALGPEAKDALEEAARSDDPEVKARARRCLREIEARGGPGEEDGPFRRDVFSDLDALAGRFSNRFGELELGAFSGAAPGGASVRVRIVEDGKTWSYSESPDGGVEATYPGDDGVETTVRAESRAAFVKAHPDLAEKLGLAAEESGGRAGGRARLFHRFGALPREWPDVRDLPSAQPPLFPRSPFAAPAPAGPRLGVLVETIDPRLAKHLRLESGGGVAVLDVEMGSTAEAVGLKEDDVIVRLNGAAIASASDLRDAVSGLEKGDAMRLEIVRRGEARVLEGRFGTVVR